MKCLKTKNCQSLISWVIFIGHLQNGQRFYFVHNETLKIKDKFKTFKKRKQKSYFSFINFLGSLNWRSAHWTNWFCFRRNCFNAGPTEVGVAAGGKADSLLRV